MYNNRLQFCVFTVVYTTMPLTLAVVMKHRFSNAINMDGEFEVQVRIQSVDEMLIKT